MKKEEKGKMRESKNYMVTGFRGVEKIREDGKNEK